MSDDTTVPILSKETLEKTSLDVDTEQFTLTNLFLSNTILLHAYAAAIIILALGLVILTLMLSWLLFWYPNQGTAAILVLGGPIATMLLMHLKQYKIVSNRTNQKP